MYHSAFLKFLYQNLKSVLHNLYFFNKKIPNFAPNTDQPLKRTNKVYQNYNNLSTFLLIKTICYEKNLHFASGTGGYNDCLCTESRSIQMGKGTKCD